MVAVLEANDPHLVGGLTGFFDSFDSGGGGWLTHTCDSMTDIEFEAGPAVDIGNKIKFII